MSTASASSGAYAPFRPRRGPAVSVVVAVGVAAMSIWLATSVAGRVVWWDRAGFLLVGGGVVWFLYRQATVRAVPSPAGLRVRNLVRTTTIGWEQVTDVHFGGGRPWVQLDLDDGDVLAVMAVQRADGPRSEAEASRLATLVAAHGTTRPAHHPTRPDPTRPDPS